MVAGSTPVPPIVFFWLLLLSGCDAMFVDHTPPSAEFTLPSVEPEVRDNGTQPIETMWNSPEACRAARAPSPHHSLRVVSWNLRWFPRGDVSRIRTDISWLACILRHMDADIVALQEVLLEQRDLQRAAALLSSVEDRGGPRYRIVVDGCPRDAGRQHLAFWVREGIDVIAHDDIASMNALGRACDGHLRPGLIVRIRHQGALLDLVTVHLDSGVEEADFQHRNTVFDALASVQQSVGSGNTVLLGDFNTMGCSRCQPAISAEQEIDTLTHAANAAGFDVRTQDIIATHRSGRHRSRLDHMLVSDTLRAWSTGRPSSLGPCSETRGHEEYFDKISDHCPVQIEFAPVRD